jgi:hypothetical protein
VDRPAQREGRRPARVRVGRLRHRLTPVVTAPPVPQGAGGVAPGTSTHHHSPKEPS